MILGYAAYVYEVRTDFITIFQLREQPRGKFGMSVIGLESIAHHALRRAPAPQTLVRVVKNENGEFAHLSVGASFSSHFTTAANACRHTSTSLGFFSSAMALVSSGTWGLYNAGQCLEMYTSTASALLADSCAWLVPCPSPAGSPFWRRLMRVGKED